MIRIEDSVRTLILGLGNPILSDDGVGISVAEELKRIVKRTDVMIEETSMGGLSLLDLLIGYDSVIMIDAIQTSKGKAGQIYRVDTSFLDCSRHTVHGERLGPRGRAAPLSYAFAPLTAPGVPGGPPRHRPVTRTREGYK